MKHFKTQWRGLEEFRLFYLHDILYRAGIFSTFFTLRTVRPLYF